MSVYISVYAGSDTLNVIKALSEGIPIDLSGVTRITLEYEGKVFDSDVHLEAFDWTTPTNTGEIWLKLGPYISTLGVFKNCQPQPARLTLYDIINTNGIVVDEGCSNPSLFVSVC